MRLMPHNSFLFGLICLLQLGLASGNSTAQTSVNVSLFPDKAKSTSYFIDGRGVVSEVVFSGLDVRTDGFDFGGPDPIYEDDVVRYLRTSKAEHPIGTKLDLKTVERIIYLIKNLLAECGYLGAKVVALGERSGKNQMKLIFQIERGPITGISDIRFTGTRIFEAEELRAVLRDCLGENWGVYNMRYVDFCAQKEVRSFMRSRGYLESTISHPSRRFLSDGFEVNLEVSEGARYRIGKVEIEGAKIFREKEIREMSGLQTGDIADGKRIQNFLYSELVRKYSDKGFLQFNAEFDPEFVLPSSDGSDRIVNIKITLDEGLAFKVRSVDFTGVNSERKKQLMENFPLRVDDIYNQTKFEDGIKKLNELGEYRFIDKDAHVELRTDEERGNVDLVVKLVTDNHSE